MNSNLCSDVKALKNEYKVLVTCFTYNQSNTIVETLRGFAMQMTDFPFVCLILDDCSKDGQRDVINQFVIDDCDHKGIEKYEDDLVQMIIAKSKYNSQCTFAFSLFKRNLYKFRSQKQEYITPWQQICKYEAYCEGDDFWMSPTKLQRQFDFLENNQDFFLVGSNALIKFDDNSKRLSYFNDCFETREVSFQTLVQKWFFPTASLFFRTSMWKIFPVWNEELHFTDDTVVMTCAIHGKVACLGDTTCIYRKGCGITSELDKKQIYMQKQHLIFYNHLLEDTGDKYAECLKNKIGIIQKKLSYYETREKSKVLLFLKFPRTAMRNTILAVIPSMKSFFKKLI